MLRFATAALLLALLLPPAASDARAAECGAIDGGSPVLVSVDAAERLAFLRGALRADARHARIWAWGFVITYSALATGEAIYALAGPSEDQGIHWVGSGASVFGVLVVVVAPPKVLADQRWLERRIAERPGSDPCALLSEAERLLLRVAAQEERNRAWFIHAGNLAFNLGVTLAMGFGFHNWQEGAIAGVVGAAIGEFQINTAPTGAIDALRRYRAADLASSGDRASLHLSLAPLAAPGLYGLALGGTF
jgi:hypothetical protein